MTLVSGQKKTVCPFSTHSLKKAQTIASSKGAVNKLFLERTRE